MIRQKKHQKICNIYIEKLWWLRSKLGKQHKPEALRFKKPANKQLIGDFSCKGEITGRR